MLLDAIDGDATPYANLRMMISVGEAFPIELKKRLFATLPNIKLSSALAMTETFGAAVLTSEDQISHAGAAGRPVPGVEVMLADEAGREVPVGEIGEILVRSGVPGAELMMRGYWNRPRIQPARFSRPEPVWRSTLCSRGILLTADHFA